MPDADKIFQPLETPTERFLAELWAEYLELKTPVRRDDNFMELGGDSLRGIQVYERVRDKYGRDIPQFDMRRPATILTLAELIDSEIEERDKLGYRSLKKMQEGVPGITPLFLVHGGDGNARAYVRLTANLDKRIPVYAFRWTGWDGLKSDYDFKSMAETYLKEMLRFRPKGPYRIGGYCIGGVVAIELARMLAEAGHEIEGPVFVWDCPNTLSKTYHVHEPWYSKKDRAAFDKLTEEMNDLKRETNPGCEPVIAPTGFSGRFEFIRKRPWLYSFLRTSQIGVGVFITRYFLLTKKIVPIKWRWIYCMTTCFFAMKRPLKTKYLGEVNFFRSEVLLWRKNLVGWWEDPFLGFGELCGSFKGYVVGSDHVDVLAEPLGAKIVNESYFGESEKPAD